MKRLRAFAAGLITILAAPSSATAQDGWTGVVRARHDLDLSFTVGGLVREVLVRPGDPVELGAPLVRLDDDSARAQVELLRFRAERELAIDSAKAKLEMARVEEQIVKELRADDSAGPFEVQKAELRTKLAEIELQIAEQAQQELRIQLARAEQELTRYELRAPMAGVVEKVEIAEGESIEALETAVRVVVTDPLRVEVFVPTDQTLGLVRGDAAWVRVEIGEPEWRRGVVSHVASVADPGSGRRLVWIDLANPGNLPAGTGASVRFEEPGHAENAAARSGRDRGMQLRDDPVVGPPDLRLGNAKHQRDLRRVQSLGVPEHHEQAVLQRERAQNGIPNPRRSG